MPQNGYNDNTDKNQTAESALYQVFEVTHWLMLNLTSQS
jgi:hypothetical protein